MQKTLIYLIILGFPVLAFAIFLASVNLLTCKSLERFDNAETKMTAFGVCYASINGDEFIKAVK